MLKLSASRLKALPGKLDIKRHSPIILYILLPVVAVASRVSVEH